LKCILLKYFIITPAKKPKMSIMRSESMCPTGADSMNLSEQFFDESMRSQYMREASMDSTLYEEHSLRSHSLSVEQDCESEVAVLETLQEIEEEPYEAPSKAASEAAPSKAASEAASSKAASEAASSKAASEAAPSKAASEAAPSKAASEAASKAVSRKKKIVAPPMHYDLHTAPADCVYQHLRELTKHNNVATEYLRSIAHEIYAQRKPIVFGYIPAPPLEDITKQIIGEDGYFFKMTTTLCEVYFIWHDREANMFLFWGSNTFKVVKAMNSIRWRIFKCCDLYATQSTKASDEDEYADMPALISCGNSPDYEHPEPC